MAPGFVPLELSRLTCMGMTSSNEPPATMQQKAGMGRDVLKSLARLEAIPIRLEAIAIRLESSAEWSEKS